MKIVVIASDGKHTLINASDGAGELDVNDALALLTAAATTVIREGWDGPEERLDVARTLASVIADNLKTRPPTREDSDV